MRGMRLNAIPEVPRAELDGRPRNHRSVSAGRKQHVLANEWMSERIASKRPPKCKTLVMAEVGVMVSRTGCATQSDKFCPHEAG